MYDVAAMKSDLESAIQVARDRVKDQFVSAFQNIYTGDLVPEAFAATRQRIDRVPLANPEDLAGVYHGSGFYVIFTDRPVQGNSCRLHSGDLQAVYRGECATTKKRVMSHLFHAKYREEYDVRAAAYRISPTNQGKSFYEAFWPHCLKLECGGPSGVNIDDELHRRHNWLVVVHRMDGSSQQVRELAEIAFDHAFGHPAGSRDA